MHASRRSMVAGASWRSSSSDERPRLWHGWSYAESRPRVDCRNRTQELVDGLELTIRHLAVDGPGHHLQDLRGVRRIPEVAALVHDLLELLESPAGRESIGARRDITGHERTEYGASREVARNAGSPRSRAFTARIATCERLLHRRSRDSDRRRRQPVGASLPSRRRAGRETRGSGQRISGT